ncbi:MAG: N-acetylmuramoyl-L-alanine amidase family protein [Elusimicrobiota bacterium]
MIRALIWLALIARPSSAAAGAFPAVERSSAPIIVVYPTQDLELPILSHEFIIGSVSNPNGRLQINGQNVPIYPDGAFLAWLPVAQGSFTFRCRLFVSSAAFRLDRRVRVDAEPKPLPPRPSAIVPSSLMPAEREDISPGDWLVVRMQATPGRPAAFRLPGLDWLPMREEGNSGFYAGSYQVRGADSLKPSPVEFRLGRGWFALKAKSRALISFRSAPPRVAVIKNDDDVLLKTGPGEGNLLPAIKGMPLVLTGRRGPWSKIWLSPDESGWIERKDVKLLPPGSPPPESSLGAISTAPGPRGTSVLLSLTQRVPFLATESKDGRELRIKLYYTTNHDNWIVYRPHERMISQIRFRQIRSDVVLVSIDLKKTALFWGYHVGFEGSAIKIDLRRAPRFALPPSSPIKGLRVFLDPGHMPSRPGAIGPLGTREMDVNYAIAQQAAELLSKEGAVALMSRRSPDDEVGLTDRPKAAAAQDADVFISIHNNNLSDGDDPFSLPHGYSIFYYHPRALALARDIYAAYKKYVPLPGEDVRFGNLLVIRMTEMPAVLTESAYMSFPDQEAMLLTPKFRETIARAIVSGLRAFAAGVRKKEIVARPRKKLRVHVKKNKKKKNRRKRA